MMVAGLRQNSGAPSSALPSEPPYDDQSARFTDSCSLRPRQEATGDEGSRVPLLLGRLSRHDLREANPPARAWKNQTQPIREAAALPEVLSMRYIGIQCSFSYHQSQLPLAQSIFDTVVHHLEYEGRFRVLGRTLPGRLELLIIPPASVPLSRQLMAAAAERIGPPLGPLLPKGLESAALGPCIEGAGFASRESFALIPVLKARQSPVECEVGDGEWGRIVAKLERGRHVRGLRVSEAGVVGRRRRPKSREAHWFPSV